MLDICQHLDILKFPLVKITKYGQGQSCSPYPSMAHERDGPPTVDMYPEEILHMHSSQRALFLSVLCLSETWPLFLL